MGYYANGGGQVVLKDKVPDYVLGMLEKSFAEVADSPDGGLWMTFEYDKYYDDEITESMNKLAPYVKSGNVEFSGDDDCVWRFHFYDGKVRYEVGRTVFEPMDGAERHSERLELLGSLADIVEDWLESKGITPSDIHCDDKDEAIKHGEDPEGLAMIYGEDYSKLTGQFEEALINYGLIEEEI